jgi:hypothetical protein
MNTKTLLLTWRRFVLGAVVFIIVWYAASYPRGMAMAYIDHACGHYELKVWCPLERWQVEYMRMLSERYGVVADAVSDYNVLPTTEWYVEGYNSVSRLLLLQKFGKDIFTECAGEAERQWRAENPDW